MAVLVVRVGGEAPVDLLSDFAPCPPPSDLFENHVPQAEEGTQLNECGRSPSRDLAQFRAGVGRGNQWRAFRFEFRTLDRLPRAAVRQVGGHLARCGGGFMVPWPTSCHARQNGGPAHVANAEKRDEPLAFDVIVHESALHLPIGGTAAMHEQVEVI